MPGFRITAPLVLMFGLSAPTHGADSSGTQCGPGNPFKDAVVCVQEYALCIAAPCAVRPKQPAIPETADCRCDVVYGASIGQAACADRQAGTANGQKTLVSTYSFQQTLPAYALMTCPATDSGGNALRYADCYNMPCVVDSKDPAKAVCQCPVLPVGNQTFITRGGSCDTSRCSQLWSGAPSAQNTQVNWQFACNLGMPQPPEANCPSTSGR